MSLGVRFKLCLAIWAFLQVLSPARGLKMQVTNLSSSSAQLSLCDLSTSPLTAPQIIKNSKTLPNIPIKRFDSFTSPLNVVGPTIDAPKFLSIPNLSFQNGGNDIRILKTRDSGTVTSSTDDITDLTPAENNIVPQINNGNRMLSNNIKPNNFPVTPNCGTEVSFENNIRNLEPIKPGYNENKPRSNGPRMLTVFGHTSSPKTSTEVSVNNEIKQNNNNGNILSNIPKIHQSLGPISPPTKLTETNFIKKDPMYFNNGFNNIPKVLNGNRESISNIQTTDVNTFNLNSPEFPTAVSNAMAVSNIPLLSDISQKQYNFDTIPNNPINPNLPENIRNQLRDVMKQEQVYGQNNGAVNFVTLPEIAPQENNIILNNMNQNGIIQQPYQFSRIENPQPKNVLENLPDISDCNVNTVNNLQRLNNDNIPPLLPIQANNVSPFNLMNEVRPPYSNINNFNNLQRFPSAINDERSQKETSIILNDNNNNLLFEVPNNIVNDIGNKRFDKHFDQRLPTIMANSPPVSPSNVQTNNQILEQTRNNLGINIQSNNQIPVIIQNNNDVLSIAENPVISFSSRNPFLDAYKSPMNMMQNKFESFNAHETERQVVPEPTCTLNNIDREYTITNKHNNHLNNLPSNNPTSFVPPLVPNDSQVNFKPSSPKFTPKITSVFPNFNAPRHLSSDAELISFINPGLPSAGAVNSQHIPIDSVFGNLPIIEPNFIPSNPYSHTSSVPTLSMSNAQPTFSPIPELENAKGIGSNPYFNEFHSQYFPPQTVHGNWPAHIEVNPFSETELPLVSPISELGISNSYTLNPTQANNFQPCGPQIEMEHLSFNNPGSPSNSFQPISINPSPYTSLPESYKPLKIPPNPYNNVNPQPVLNYAEPSLNSVIQSSQDFVPNFRILPSSAINMSPNNAGGIIQQAEILNPYFNIPVEAPIPSVTQSFDISNTFEPVINEVPVFNSGFTPYARPFNPVYNIIQAMPNNIVSIEPTTVQDSSFNPIYYTQPQTVFTENPHSPPTPVLQNVEVTKIVPVQPNITPFSTFNPSFDLSNEIQHLNIPSNLHENIPPPHILTNSQQYLPIPEISTPLNSFNPQNSSPKVSITQELPYIPQNNFNLQSEPNLISPVSNLPNVYTSNAIQQFPPSIQYLPPSVSYTNLSPYNQFSSITDLGSVVAKNVLNNLISKKLNSKAAQYLPVANLPPVNPYLPNSFYPSPIYYESAPTISTIPTSLYDQAIPMISTLASPNINFPTNSHPYEYLEVPDYFIDYTDLSTTFNEVTETSDIPDVDYDYGNEITPFIPYMSSLKVNVLPVIDGVSLEPILPNNILANVHPNLLTPYPNTPYPIGSQLDILPSLKTKCRDAKEFERLISLFVLSELINGNENRDWEGLEKIIALLCVT